MPAAEIEAAVIDQMRGVLRTPEVIVATWRSARDQGDGLNEADVREALQSLDPLWDELFPTEQARTLQLLIERVEIHLNRIDLRFRVDGLQSIVTDITAGRRAA